MDIVIVLRDFMAKGGYVLYAILLLAICLWWLILDRYYYFYREHAARVKEVQAVWQKRSENHSWFAMVERRSLISQVDVCMLNNLTLIPVIIALLPMFGLLGTVTGMIQVFDVMAFMGSGNPRAMADGVSAATIPTMSGMVVALVAIPFATQLNRRYHSELQMLNDTLKLGD